MESENKDETSAMRIKCATYLKQAIHDHERCGQPHDENLVRSAKNVLDVIQSDKRLNTTGIKALVSRLILALKHFSNPSIQSVKHSTLYVPKPHLAQSEPSTSGKDVRKFDAISSRLNRQTCDGSFPSIQFNKGSNSLSNKFNCVHDFQQELIDNNTVNKIKKTLEPILQSLKPDAWKSEVYQDIVTIKLLKIIDKYDTNEKPKRINQSEEFNKPAKPSSNLPPNKFALKPKQKINRSELSNQMFNSGKIPLELKRLRNTSSFCATAPVTKRRITTDIRFLNKSGSELQNDLNETNAGAAAAINYDQNYFNNNHYHHPNQNCLDNSYSGDKKEKRFSKIRSTICDPTKGSPQLSDTDRKNINKEVHCSNDLFNKLCLLCGSTDAHLANHYSKKHPTADVFISRPSPQMVAQIRQQTQRPIIGESNKIHALCYFCGVEKTFYKKYWPKHLLTHTGECMFYCRNCDSKVQTKAKHKDCTVHSIESVFEYNLRKGDLAAFMCKLCNYIQVQEKRITMHLINEHEFVAADLSNSYERVILLSSSFEGKLNISFKYDAVEDANRYKCDKPQCDGQFAGPNELRQHFLQKHPSETEYSCPHCNKDERQQFNSIDDITSHLNLHADELFGCSLCEFFHNREIDVIKHITQEHSIHRMLVNRRRGPVNAYLMDQISYSFKCKVCNASFDDPKNVTSHFKQEHVYQTVDAKVVQTVKRIDTGKTVVKNRIAAMPENTWYFRESFVCNICLRTEWTKSQLIAHHIELHADSSLQFKRIETLWVSKTQLENPEELTVENAAFDRSIVYCCVHCDAINNNTNIYCSIDRLYKHWLSVHASSLSTIKPFQFCVKKLIACYYCNVISTFRGIKAHHQANHKNDPFVTVNEMSEKRCGLCEYDGTDLYDHYKQVHSRDDYVTNKWDEPYDFINDVFLENLLNIDIHKKRKCGHCGGIFETDSAICSHHSVEHFVLKLDIKQITDQRIFYMAGCCNDCILIDEQRVLQHLRNHQRPFSCAVCSIEFDQIVDAIEHDKNVHKRYNALSERCTTLSKKLSQLDMAIKVVFGNGLVLTKLSFTGTKYYDAFNITNCVKGIVRVEKDKCVIFDIRQLTTTRNDKV